MSVAIEDGWEILTWIKCGVPFRRITLLALATIRSSLAQVHDQFYDKPLAFLDIPAQWACQRSCWTLRPCLFLNSQRTWILAKAQLKYFRYCLRIYWSSRIKLNVAVYSWLMNINWIWIEKAILHENAWRILYSTPTNQTTNKSSTVRKSKIFFLARSFLAIL